MTNPKVKVLVYTSLHELEKQTCWWMEAHGYTLAGPVTIGLNPNGNTIYVATLLRPEV